MDWLLVVPYCLLCALIAVLWWIGWTARAMLAWIMGIGIHVFIVARAWADDVRARLEER